MWEFKAPFGGPVNMDGPSAAAVAMALRRARLTLKKIDGYFGRSGGRLQRRKPVWQLWPRVVSELWVDLS